jgi:hypothetical protein
MIDEALKQWATARQIEYIDAIDECGSVRGAAKKMGLNKNTLSDALASLKRRAATKGYSPEHDYTKPCPDPFVVKGVSTYYNKDGEVSGQWVKSSLDQQRLLDMLKVAVAAMNEDIKPVLPVAAPGLELNANLCNLITLTDTHIGQLSWPDETGNDWNLKIAEETLIGAFKHLIHTSPPAKTCIINELGDFLHFDSLDAVTPMNKNLLDSDGRFPKLVATAIRVLRSIIAEALATHEIVRVVICEGNHDVSASVWLRQMMMVLYENEPRVVVNKSEMAYQAIKFGTTLLGFHHGHLAKKERLPAIFAANHRKMWGETTKCFIHVGHMHHVDQKEYDGATVIQHSTISGRDSYAARHGYSSDRCMTAFCYHVEYGEVSRSSVYPEMLA